MAVSPAKKSITKPPVKKVAPAKKPTAKKTVRKTSSTKARKVSAEERYRMIEVTAYYIAERNSFQGNAIDFWIAAEAEISQTLV